MITGYRQLTPGEEDLINMIKAKAEEVGRLVDLMVPHRDDSPANPPDQRWVAIGRTHLQEGFMALVRSVAKPTTF